jgi:hypothetical protein
MTAPTTRAVALPDGTAAPALGMGTWYLGETPTDTTSSSTPFALAWTSA